MFRGFTIVKLEFLLWLLLSSSGLEFGLLEEAEVGFISGLENIRGERVRVSFFLDVFLRVRRGWVWFEKDVLALFFSFFLEIRMKLFEFFLFAYFGIFEEVCEVKLEG